MGLFRRRRDRRAGARRAIEDVDLDSLLALVADDLGYSWEFTPDGATLVLSGPRRVAVALTGLRREVARRPREDWPTLAAGHLTRAVERGDHLPDVCDLARVRPLLRTRLVRADDLREDPSRLIGRHLGSDLVEILTVYGRPVRPEEAFCWPVTPAEALDLAAANVLADERLTSERADLDGTPVWIMSGSDSGAAVHLRRIEDYLLVSPDGVMVAMPHPGEMIVHPIGGLSVMRAIERLWLHARREYRARDDGLSPHVYWWKDGTLTKIQADLVVQDGQRRLVVAPPPEFARMLADLARGR
ncbi:hypothetical protein Ssi03_55080 [Sphaerisporangium siamense]|uniref:Uncharacterized protein n=1 Tax=Sphaerisporangium siamense TaxID=795645 RepID=A0A7W7DDN4_9ACTN|nr:hypothetical protein [Sphaerisporangium siamense]MBB4703488.1 hypothetical protein [Sphaerisporangium siamense]GII87518.1 hypothetical protein Ssi03_55080 [Sphaerisporangium siamense]